MNRRTLTKTITRIPVTYSLGAIFLLFVGLYLYFAFYTAYLVASTENTENRVKEMRGTLSSLESNYIEITKDLDILFAYEQGYQDGVGDTTYITRQSRTARIDN